MSKQLSTESLNINGISFLQGTVDPTAGSLGTVPLGSFYVRTSDGVWYRKDGATDTEWIIAAPAYAVGQKGFAGNGRDGDVTLPVGTTALVRPMFYNNLTVPNGAVLIIDGFRLHVRGTLTVEVGGAVRQNGSAGSGSTGGAAAPTTSLSNRLQTGSPGSNGGSTAASSGTTARAARTPWSATDAGRGGKGGAGATTGSGTTGSISVLVPTMNTSAWFLWCQSTGSALMQGGSGGTGGGGNGAGLPGGGGGGGGGVMWIACPNIVNNGAIEARGGDGATPPSGGNCGGGGGGGGGRVILVTQTYTGTAPDVSGGAGAAGSGTGAAGANGTTGSIWTMII